MKRNWLTIGCFLLGFAGSAFAADQTSSTSGGGGSNVTLKDERFAIGPQLGVTSFRDANDNFTSRGTAGIGIDLNLMPGDEQPVYLGIATGGFYTNVGGSGANFFGSNNNNNAVSQSNAWMVNIPADLKLGYNMSERTRLAVHGGGNVIYRNDASMVNLGPIANTNTTNGRDWSLYPNAGADFEWKVSKRMDLMVRPDYTFTKGNDILQGTLAANILF